MIKKYSKLFIGLIIIVFGVLVFRVLQGVPEFENMSKEIKTTKNKVSANIKIIKMIDTIDHLFVKKVEGNNYDVEFFDTLDVFLDKLIVLKLNINYPKSFTKLKKLQELLENKPNNNSAKELLVELDYFYTILFESTLSEFTEEDKNSLVGVMKNNHDFVSNVIILSLFAVSVFVFWVFGLNKNIKKRIELETSLKDLNNNLENKVQERTKELESILYIDPLTALKNAIALKEDIKKAYLTTVVMIRLNDFGRLNELYGATAGNLFLVQFAELLRDYAKDKNFKLYRYAGVEFAFLDDSGLVDTEKLEVEIEDLISLANKSCIDVHLIDEIFQVDVTIGLASGTEKVLDNATQALKYARNHNCSFTFYNINIDQDEENKKVLDRKKEMKKTLDNDRFVPVFQPIVNTDGEVVKYEALMRMLKYDDQKEVLLSPDHFLDVALKTNMYHRISEMTMRKSIEYFKDKNIDFSLNFTLWDIENKVFVRTIEDLIKKYDIGKRVVFEIVESENIENYEMFKKFIDRFRKLGVRIAIDDFGSGYSNFTYVIDIKPDYLKIDGSLIKDIDKDKEAYILVKAIVELSKGLGIKTIAEFVRSKEVFEVCKKLGVDEFQGYLFSAPFREI